LEDVSHDTAPEGQFYGWEPEHRSSRNSSRAGRQSRGLGTGTSYSPANDSEEDGTGEVKRHRGILVKEGTTFESMWPITRRQKAFLWEGLKSVGLSWGVEWSGEMQLPCS
jgi:hypothetical protein